MKPNEVRREILDQHASLRRKMAAARAAADLVHRGAPIAELRRALVDVAEALRVHGLREEEVMDELFPTLDGWGHKPLMYDEHVEEHRQLCDALLDASTQPDVHAAVTAARSLLDQIREHMEREERVLLAEDAVAGEPAPPAP